jgi:hypothetical protein
MMHVPFPRSSTIGLYVIAVVAVLWSLSEPAAAYPTGSMSCADIGDFAAATVVGKQNGQTLKEALAKVDKATTGRAIERKNLRQIVRAIYTEPWAKSLSEQGAKAAFTADCEAQPGD